MRVRNNIIDQYERQTDGNYYAINLQLKSGEVIRLEEQAKSQKDAYLAYVRNGIDPMIIEMGNTLYRILPNDIERIDVKAYGDAQAKGLFPVMKIVMAKSRLETATFTRFFTFLTLVFIGAFTGALVKSMIDGQIIDMLFTPSILNTYLTMGMDWFSKGASLLSLVMLGLVITDLVLKPLTKFHVIDHNRHYLAGTKTLHVLLLAGFWFGSRVFLSVLDKVIQVLG